MKTVVLAQHGAQSGEKIDEGLAKNHIGGAIFSPRDISFDNLGLRLHRMAESHPKAMRLFDPQYYATFLASRADSRLGSLGTDDNYAGYFSPRSRRDLEREAFIRREIRNVLSFQSALELSALIAPNILVSRSFNSIEGAIAKNFVRYCLSSTPGTGDSRDIYATIAVSRDALLEQDELKEFLAEITAMDRRPKGFYLLVAANSADARSDIFHADVIAAWMFMNYALKSNGFRVINGYSDLLTPYLSIAGAFAGCTGWFSNLRSFSMARFRPSRGGRLPTERYLSTRLINRIAFHELHALREVLPQVLNGLSTDKLYPADNGSLPVRSLEVIQTWEALTHITAGYESLKIEAGLAKALRDIKSARALYESIRIEGVSLDPRSSDEHLDAVEEGVRSFARLGEVKLS